MNERRASHLSSFEITTERFFLRSLTTEDVTERYLGWLSDPVTTRFIETASMTNVRNELLAYVAERCQKNDVLFLGIFVKSSLEHIGNLKYEPIDFDKKFAVMGIMIGQPEWRGKAVAPEVIGETTKWLNRTLGIEKILLGVGKKNVHGIAAYERCGFIPTATDEMSLDLTHSFAMCKSLID